MANPLSLSVSSRPEYDASASLDVDVWAPPCQVPAMPASVPSLRKAERPEKQASQVR